MELCFRAALENLMENEPAGGTVIAMCCGHNDTGERTGAAVGNK